MPWLVAPRALADWLGLASAPSETRALTAMLGINDPAERGRLLRLGFGEALAWDTALDELESRIVRLVERAEAIPRHRTVGALRLDLLAREGFVAGRALALHPREFGLLWRLADAPGQAVAPAALLRDVWRLSFRPETNSLAVHVSRLRGKLRIAGLDGLIETGVDGAYRLAVPDPNGHFPLDASCRLGKEQDQEDSTTARQD